MNKEQVEEKTVTELLRRKSELSNASQHLVDAITKAAEQLACYQSSNYEELKDVLFELDLIDKALADRGVDNYVSRSDLTATFKFGFEQLSSFTKKVNKSE